MVYLRGIKLTANRLDELHKIAHKVVLSKSWYNPDPFPHYTVICPFKQDKIKKLLEKGK